jgi:hypothetical protein
LLELPSIDDRKQWESAGDMVREMRMLDIDTKKEHQGVSSTVALRAREDAIKRTFGMEHPSTLLELAD